MESQTKTWYTLKPSNIIIPFHALGEDVARQMVHQREGPFNDLMLALAWERFLLSNASQPSYGVSPTNLDKQIEEKEDCLSHADLRLEAIYHSLLERQHLDSDTKQFLEQQQQNSSKSSMEEEAIEEEEWTLPVDSYVELYSEEKVNRRFINARNYLMHHWRPLPIEEVEYEIKN